MFYFLLIIPSEEVAYSKVSSELLIVLGFLPVRDGWGVFYVINYLADGFVGMMAHNLHVVEDGAVGFDGLPDAVFQDFQR